MKPITDPIVIHRYTRAQAIADGVLVDADTLESGIARQAGFTVPVAFTSAAWADTVAWDETIESSKPHPAAQDPIGRLWDVLTMSRLTVQHHTGDRATFRVLRVPPAGPKVTPTLTELVLHIGPGDAGEPVITIMQPGED